MTNNSILNQEKFWNILEYLVSLDHNKNFEEICTDLSITKWQLNSFISFLKQVDYQLEIYQCEEKKFVKIPDKKPSIKMEFSLLEWLSFQAHFPIMAQAEGKPFHEDLKEKLVQLESQFKEHDLYEPLPTLESILDSGNLELVGSNETQAKSGIISFLEESVLEKITTQLTIQDKTLKVFPRKIVYIAGSLHLIGENTLDGTLVSVDIDTISQAFEEPTHWKENFSKIEVEDFIASFRLIEENSIRLVLKVFSQEKFNLNLNHQYFEKPCMFANAKGEHIWAATIEPNEEIFNWLQELGSDVEILDPLDFKHEFLKHCENELKKLA